MKILIPIILAMTVMATVYAVSDSEDSDGAIVNPSTGTQVGDLYYTLFNREAYVAGVSSNTLTSVTIPATIEVGGTTYNVTAIKDSVFRDMTSLTSVTLSDGMANIGAAAFRGCTNLALTSLPDSVTIIGANAFSGCASLALTSLPDGVTRIENSTFNSCTNLALTSLPDRVTSIGSNAFQGCTGLTSVTLPDGVTSIGNSAFQGCTGLTSVNLPDGLTSVEAVAFQNCTNLEYLVITSSPTIGANAFQGTSITEILNLGNTEISAGSYGLPSDCVVRSNIEDVSMIQQVEYVEHSTTVEEKEGIAYAILAIVPIFVVLAILMYVVQYFRDPRKL